MRNPVVPIEAKVSPDHPFFDLIKEAYRVFDYPKPTSTEVCQNCCMYPEIERDFFKPAIEDLPLAYVQDWYDAAYDPKGVAKETWAYLLPRILEILAAGEDVTRVSIEVSLSRFKTGKAENWSAKEWSVLDRFQRAYLKSSIGRKDNLDDLICMFSLGGWDLSELLEQVGAASDADLAERLWTDWCRCAPRRESVWLTAFWDDDGGKIAFDFYTSRELYDRMEALALADDGDVELAAKASAVAAVIEANAQWR